MPRAPSPCIHPGCTHDATTSSRCPTHAAAYHRHHDRNRGTAHARGYTHRWNRRAAAYRNRNPYCECQGCNACQPSQARCLRDATDTDHVTPRRTLLAQGVGDPDRPEFLQALCRQCHSSKTATEDGGGWKPWGTTADV